MILNYDNAFMIVSTSRFDLYDITSSYAGVFQGFSGKILVPQVCMHVCAYIRACTGNVENRGEKTRTWETTEPGGTFCIQGPEEPEEESVERAESIARCKSAIV